MAESPSSPHYGNCDECMYVFTRFATSCGRTQIPRLANAVSVITTVFRTRFAQIAGDAAMACVPPAKTTGREKFGNATGQYRPKTNSSAREGRMPTPDGLPTAEEDPEFWKRYRKLETHIEDCWECRTAIPPLQLCPTGFDLLRRCFLSSP